MLSNSMAKRRGHLDRSSTQIHFICVLENFTNYIKNNKLLLILRFIEKMGT